MAPELPRVGRSSSWLINCVDSVDRRGGGCRGSRALPIRWRRLRGYARLDDRIDEDSTPSESWKAAVAGRCELDDE